MLYRETVETPTLELIKKLCKDPLFDDFNLVGGTALSLQLGHRKSIDIDLFSNKPFDSNAVANHLVKHFNGEIVRELSNGIWCFVDDIKMDLMSHQYPWIEPAKTIDNIRMVSLLDIAAMKINVIHGKGTRLKDLADMYILLEHYSLNQILDAYLKKYTNVNIGFAKYSLLYNKNVGKDSIEYIGTPVAKREITIRMKQAVLNPDKVFIPRQDNLLQKKPSASRKGLRP